MASKRNPTVPVPADDDDELSKLINSIGEDESIAATGKSTKSTLTKPSSTTKVAKASSSQSEQDLLAELESYTAPEPRSTSRPATPKVISTPNPPPPPRSSRPSEESRPTAARKSAESSRSFHNSHVPGESTPNPGIPPSASSPTESPTPVPTSSGISWWNTLTATATATLKQAESTIKEIQSTEEAKRWTSQVTSNVSNLRSNVSTLRDRALPTFNTILETLAPPISSHERLQIHITHDLIGYPSLDPLIYQTFSRVMAQVEGGELLVIQRGQISSPRSGPDSGGYMSSGRSGSGWSDGPWWRQETNHRTLSGLAGLPEATKLVRVAAETYAEEFYAAAEGGLEAAAKRATDELSESNPVRRSDIFLAIQAVGYTQATDLFPTAAPATATAPSDPTAEEKLLTFAIHLTDPIHGIAFSTLTQAIPSIWVDWLEITPTSGEVAPEVGAGGLDPREWVAEWIEEVLGLGIGVIAQRYVARRMGVDGMARGATEDGLGKARETVVESGGGEVARAI